MYEELCKVSVTEDGISEYIPIAKDKIIKRLLDESKLFVPD